MFVSLRAPSPVFVVLLASQCFYINLFDETMWLISGLGCVAGGVQNRSRKDVKEAKVPKGREESPAGTAKKKSGLRGIRGLV